MLMTADDLQNFLNDFLANKMCHENCLICLYLKVTELFMKHLKTNLENVKQGTQCACSINIYVMEVYINFLSYNKGRWPMS